MFKQQKKFLIVFAIELIFCLTGKSQNNDTLTTSQQWNIHFQNTEILQYHPAFHADYSGKNSLSPNIETTLSSTSTLFLGIQLWKNGIIYFDPELSAGKGFSKTLGIAGFPNGEVYRVSDPNPHYTNARYYLRQIFPLSKKYIHVDDDENQLANKQPESYFGITLGKFSIMDYFDNNPYSHDPRTQFFNWALMGNGAWDYPADTKGYDNGTVLEWVNPKWAMRFCSVMVPTVPNGSEFDADIKHANSEALEFERTFSINNREGIVHVLGFFTEAKMGSYQKAINWGIAYNKAPDIDSVHQIENTKYGFGISLTQQINIYSGLFFRASWNDGHNETWMFTEVDRSLSGGFNFNGNAWNRKEDEIGVAFIVNGLSEWHKNYLAAGGYGFIIGDGKLNYGHEKIAEIYYSYHIKLLGLAISPDYQFIINPAYNKDRGPVNVFGLRAHFEF
jgi:high affinity Mn2+ porin